MLAREAMAHTGHTGRPWCSSRQSAGETANWPILVNLYGADLKQLSAYAVQLNEKLQTLPQFIDVKAGEPRQP